MSFISDEIFMMLELICLLKPSRDGPNGKVLVTAIFITGFLNRIADIHVFLAYSQGKKFWPGAMTART